MLLNLAGRHSARVQRENLFIKALEAGLPFRHDLWREASIAIPRHLNGQFTEVTFERLLGLAISGDPDRLQQVVWNLVANAIKFTPKGGRVQLRLERVDSHLEITVSDSGKGIAPEFLPYVFDRFRQAEQTTTRTHGGLGYIRRYRK